MYKMILCSLLLCGKVFAANGYIYLQNVNNVFGATDTIQFKIVANDKSHSAVKTVATGEVAPSQVFNYRLADFGLTEGYLDIYAKNANTDYIACEAGFPYSSSVLVVVHGWNKTATHPTCAIVEE